VLNTAKAQDKQAVVRFEFYFVPFVYFKSLCQGKWKEPRITRIQRIEIR